MPGDSCIVCGNSRAKDPGISMYRFPKNQEKRQRWLMCLNLEESGVKYHHRVCSRHFPNGDGKNNDPQLTLGKRFASPVKPWTSRAKRVKTREAAKKILFESPSPAPSSDKNVSLASSPDSVLPPIGQSDHEALVATFGEQYDTVYSVHELPDANCDAPGPSTSVRSISVNEKNVIDRALVSRIEMLESENAQLKTMVQERSRTPFSIQCIEADDKLIKLYTGFSTYSIFFSFYKFLGPSVEELTYWGMKENTGKRHRQSKLTPINQLLLVLMKLRLNLRNKDLAVRFCVGESTVSRYIITWVCFLYQHMKEIMWMPDSEQVFATLPPSFRDKYPSTFAIIDGSELFLQTPSDLFMQSSTWSSYKHHNTAKFLIGCTPNGCICFISPLYVGSISDVELTRVSGLIDQLKGRDGISIMADRGFTIKDQLSSIGVKLNIPPFMEGRTHLPANEVKKGRQIASLRIHVERAIGRVKQFGILKGTFSLSMIRLLNQIVCVCAWLTNFHPVLLPPPLGSSETDEDDVAGYFCSLCSDSDSDSDYEC